MNTISIIYLMVFILVICRLCPFGHGLGRRSRYSDSLRAGRSEVRILVWAKFSAPVQTGPGAHPASCTVGTGPFPRVKRPGRGADHPPPSKHRGHEGVELYLYSPSGPQWPVIGRTNVPLDTGPIFKFRESETPWNVISIKEYLT